MINKIVLALFFSIGLVPNLFGEVHPVRGRLAEGKDSAVSGRLTSNGVKILSAVPAGTVQGKEAANNIVVTFNQPMVPLENSCSLSH